MGARSVDFLEGSIGPGRFTTVDRGLTLDSGRAYHPPDDDAPGAYVRTARSCASWGPNRLPPRPMERIAGFPDEADLPAEEAASRQGARLPRPDEDDGGPPSARRSPGTGTQAADGLTDGRGGRTPRLVMISRPRDFEALQREGSIRSHPLLHARFRRTGLPETRFGLSTGRRLGGAVVRNRVRRRIREALRVMAPSYQPGWDVLIICRPAVVAADHDALVGAVRRLLTRGGVIEGSATR